VLRGGQGLWDYDVIFRPMLIAWPNLAQLRDGILQARRDGRTRADVANTRTWAQMKCSSASDSARACYSNGLSCGRMSGIEVDGDAPRGAMHARFAPSGTSTRGPVPEPAAGHGARLARFVFAHWPVRAARGGSFRKAADEEFDGTSVWAWCHFNMTG